ncbi:hypothetical protein [Nostoc sp. DedQUE07]|nr:hypothetical protein [Nostoc sp. DedQUE07]MDZ8131912.1 hypothetical protein [Nostoc sp. DedQUE07]
MTLEESQKQYKKLQEQYASLCHAMQTGVAFKINIEVSILLVGRA